MMVEPGSGNRKRTEPNTDNKREGTSALSRGRTKAPGTENTIKYTQKYTKQKSKAEECWAAVPELFILHLALLFSDGAAKPPQLLPGCRTVWLVSLLRSFIT